MRGCDGLGTMIRNAGLGLPLPVGALAVPVSPSARFGLLIAVVGRTPLLPSRFRPAGLAGGSVKIAEVHYQSAGFARAGQVRENGQRLRST